jgi:hypothetical protein
MSEDQFFKPLDDKSKNFTLGAPICSQRSTLSMFSPIAKSLSLNFLETAQNLTSCSFLKALYQLENI